MELVDNLMNITWVLIFIVQAILLRFITLLLLNIEVEGSKALYFAIIN
jgi:hypothetical protein